MNDCVSPILTDILWDIMNDPLFMPFRLVGGTNLALRFKHRLSIDIDLFTDAEYGSLNFRNYENWFKERFHYVDPSDTSSKIGMGRMYYVGNNAHEAIKIDLIYESEPFLFPEENNNGIRMASLKEIAVMKLNAIFNGGRKKDFWDLHYLLIDEDLKLSDLITLHKKRFPYQHEEQLLLKQLQNFEKADNEPDPICRLGKSWDLIRLDLLDILSEYDTNTN